MNDLINHGVIDAPRRDTDFAGGSLPFVLNNPLGDWTNPLNTKEKQWGPDGDKMNCVTQAQHNDFEDWLDWMIANNKLPQAHVKFLQDNGYFDANGFINFSDKYNSILNGTTKDGNSLVAVADDARLRTVNGKLVGSGLIPQSMLPENIDDPWDVYYNPAQITPAMRALGRKFLDYFQINYEWIDLWIDKTALLKELQQCPIQLVVPGHSICGIKADLVTATIEDTYDPYIKVWDRKMFTSGMKIVLTPIINPEKGEPMVYFKVKGKAAIYEFVNGSWRGYDDPTSYQKDISGKVVKIIELDQAEFDKLPQLFPI